MTAKTLATALLIAAAPVSAAQAQYASPPPLYPYMVQNGYGVQTAQPYAVQVAPNTYVIQRPGWQHEYSDVRGRKRTARPAPGRFDRPHKPVDHALVDELRKRVKKSDAQASVGPGQKSTVNTTRIIRHAPVVRETTRVVDDPPRVIDQITVDNSEETANRGILTQPRRSSPNTTASVDLPAPAAPESGPRTIRAEAEVTILGPDRMTIRLFRKGQGPFAKAKPSE